METKKKKKRLWILLIIIAAVLVVGIAAILIIKTMGSEVSSLDNTVQVQEVEKRDLSDYMSFNGTVSGKSCTNVVSEASGEVLEVSVQVGDTVSIGDKLITLDTTEIEKEIADLEKIIANTNALVQNEATMREKNLEYTIADCEKEKKIASDDVVKAQNEVNSILQRIDVLKKSIEEKENELLKLVETNPSYSTLLEELSTLKEEKTGAELLFTEANAALKEAEENYNNVVSNNERAILEVQNNINMAKYQTDETEDLKKQLEELKKQLEDCQLIAPCSGVITAVNVSVGDSYGAGATMITIEDTSTLKVIVTVDEKDIMNLAEGMEAVIKTVATGDEEIAGTVTRVVRVKNQSTNTDDMLSYYGQEGYSAEITIDSANLLIGMNATAKVILNEKKDVLSVPYDLIQYDENGDTYVLVAEETENGESIAVRKNISLGEEIDYYIEVIDGELSDGDLIIYDYMGVITEGSTFISEQLYFGEDMSMEDIMNE